MRRGRRELRRKNKEYEVRVKGRLKRLLSESVAWEERGGKRRTEKIKKDNEKGPACE